MQEILASPDRAQAWIDAFEGKTVDWAAVFKDYNSGVDNPICQHYEMLADHYPDAKIILTVSGSYGLGLLLLVHHQQGQTTII